MKDAYYFSHDSNAKDDPKCMLLIDQLGLEGYGIFWILVETLRDQPDYKYPLELVPILGRRYNTSAEKMLAVVKNYMLFQIDEENNFFSLSLRERMEKLASVREKRRLAGLKSGESRRKSIESNTCSTHVQQELSKNEQSKVKESKEKESKEKESKVKESKEDVKPKTKRFVPPTISELEEFFKSKHNLIDDKAKEQANLFYNHYKAQNWKLKGGNKMSDWKAAINGTWMRNYKKFNVEASEGKVRLGRTIRR